jgi:hypothetical protein
VLSTLKYLLLAAPVHAGMSAVRLLGDTVQLLGDTSLLLRCMLTLGRTCRPCCPSSHGKLQPGRCSATGTAAAAAAAAAVSSGNCRHVAVGRQHCGATAAHVLLLSRCDCSHV